MAEMLYLQDKVAIVRPAAKQHTCDLCTATIDKKITYVSFRSFYKINGVPTNKQDVEKFCLSCTTAKITLMRMKKQFTAKEIATLKKLIRILNGANT